MKLDLIETDGRIFYMVCTFIKPDDPIFTCWTTKAEAVREYKKMCRQYPEYRSTITRFNEYGVDDEE